MAIEKRILEKLKFRKYPEAEEVVNDEDFDPYWESITIRQCSRYGCSGGSLYEREVVDRGGGSGDIIYWVKYCSRCGGREEHVADVE